MLVTPGRIEQNNLITAKLELNARMFTKRLTSQEIFHNKISNGNIQLEWTLTDYRSFFCMQKQSLARYLLITGNQFASAKWQF